MVVAIAVALVGIPLMVRSEREQRKRTPTAGMIGIADEIFHPGAHQADLIWVAQTEMPAPAPLAGDPFPEGKVTLQLPARSG
ncbi:hypothetical protein B7R54_00535 [Subtercola boreus]|uniref:Uncharacterized protein n=1 Tax=Subtercola boreus TaxID=120213 RepID=A0A3E0VD81_9MICO|nr:hypothetical protein [Subtercola boreus]RFA07866.1 hypothetical protein B7R54_00535 [Subtercola boreus]TQL55281.1 hypothetical protein FB464_2844 [Subtercola boreus]